MQSRSRLTDFTAGPLPLTTANRAQLKIPLILVLGSLLFSYFLFWALPSVFEVWNAQTVDRLFSLRTELKGFSPPYHHRVVHVDFNQTSFERLNQRYFSRAHYATLVRALDSMGVSAQAFDVILPAYTQQPDDTALVEEIRKAGKVYLGIAFELLPAQMHPEKIDEKKTDQALLKRMKWAVKGNGNSRLFYRGLNPLFAFPELATACRGLGSVSVKFDRDGVLRRIPLLVRYQDGLFPSLALLTACDYLKVLPTDLVLSPGKHLLLKGATIPGKKETLDIEIPIDKRGNIIVNYAGPWEFMDHYSVADILEAAGDPEKLRTWREELEGKIAVVADVTTGSADVGPVPTDPNYPLVGVHATVINSILTQSFLKELSWMEMLMLEVLMMVILLFLGVKCSSGYFCLGSAAIACCFTAAAGALFLWGNTITHLIRPLLILVASTAGIIIYRYTHEEKMKMLIIRQRDLVRETFGRYLSNEVVDALLDKPGGLRMSGEIREVTFVVSDLRGFTSMMSHLSPQKVIEIMNRYFERMVEVIAHYRGTVQEFQGDGLLIFFGAPLRSDDDPYRAVACAIAMQKAVKELNAEQRLLGLPELSMGIGINTGEVVVGNIGCEKRASYGAIGTAINLAYRIESLTLGGQVLVSPSTYDKVQALIEVRESREVSFKGIPHSIRVYDAAGVRGEYGISLPEKEEDHFLSLDPPLPVTCFVLEGKTLSEKPISGHMTSLGDHSAIVSVTQQLEEFSNVKIVIFSGQPHASLEAYAKVFKLKPSDQQCSTWSTWLEFTSVPRDFKQILRNHPAATGRILKPNPNA